MKKSMAISKPDSQHKSISKSASAPRPRFTPQIHPIAGANSCRTRGRNLEWGLGYILGALVIACTGFAPVPASAQASLGTISVQAPIYLQLDSRFPSGQRSRRELESRTQASQIQRWFRVRTQVANRSLHGWIPEDHVLTTLKLATMVRLKVSVPDRFAPHVDSIRQTRLPVNSPLVVLDQLGSWMRVRPLTDTALGADSWVPTSALRRDSLEQSRKAYVVKRSDLRLQPDKKSTVLSQVHAGEMILVTQERKIGSRAWIEMRTENNTPMWLPREHVWLATDVDERWLRPQGINLELRSAPHPTADVVTRLKSEARLEVLGQRNLRWGRVLFDKQTYWWPMSDEDRQLENARPSMTLSFEDLRQRKIFDQVKSEELGLHIVSAQGVFISTDGENYRRVERFESKNFPLSLTPTGVVIAGPYRSSDQGQNWEQWIRWDRLAETLAETEDAEAFARMRMAAIHALDQDGRHVQAVLDVGKGRKIRVETSDQGQSWIEL